MSFIVGQLHPTYRQRARDLRAKQHAEVQAGKWAGASPVRTLPPEERAAYEAALLERDKPKLLPWSTPAPAPEPKPEPEEGSMTNLERARSLRAELEQAQKTIADKRREALTIADELEQEARALREAAGAVPVEVVHAFPPPKASPKPTPRERPAVKGRGYGQQRARIIAAMPVGEEVRARTIADAVGISIHSAGAELRDLARRGEIERTGRGLFRRAG